MARSFRRYTCRPKWRGFSPGRMSLPGPDRYCCGAPFRRRSGEDRTWPKHRRFDENDLGCVKTKSDLVVMQSGGRIFVLFSSAHDHRAQNSGCGYTARSFHTAWTRSRHWQFARLQASKAQPLARVTAAASLCLNPGVFDDRPPFLGVGLHERAERRPQIGAAGCLAMLWCLSRLSRSSACRRSGNVPGCLATWNSG